ncbi:thioredoxin domain-containing protein [Cellulomonas sp. HZM]|uniref:DsbA family protein n=1 Tax=Cellulomonas sp. HZM TaxID=1454010 RepID=UPI00068E25D8|nr:thioredoxin domain-containing protein [Cellulomonas sp. HZM]
MSGPTSGPTRSDEAQGGAVDVRPDRHVYGEPSAPVTIVEHGDLECPHCRAAAPVLRELVDTSDGRVRLVWRHFPLFEVHPHALVAALASEAAAERGSFWQMHDVLLAHQDRLTEPDLRAYARELGVDPASAAGDAAQRFAPAVEADYLAGVAAGVHGTPTLFVDGERFSGPPDAVRLRAAVDAALAARSAGDGTR